MRARRGVACVADGTAAADVVGDGDDVGGGVSDDGDAPVGDVSDGDTWGVGPHPLSDHAMPPNAAARNRSRREIAAEVSDISPNGIEDRARTPPNGDDGPHANDGRGHRRWRRDR